MMTMLPGFRSLGGGQILCQNAVVLVTCSMKLLLALVSTFIGLRDKQRIAGSSAKAIALPSRRRAQPGAGKAARSGCHGTCAERAARAAGRTPRAARFTPAARRSVAPLEAD